MHTAHPHPAPFELQPPDLSRWRTGNTGTPGVWRFEATQPGREVLVTALVHGNELCGAWALWEALEAGVRPRSGALTLAFCNLSAFDQAVVSVCSMQGGHPGAMSVIPGEVTLVGTVRSFRPEVQELVERRLTELCSAVALGFGATASVRYERIYPATVNTAAEARFAGDVAASIVGEENLVRDMEPSMGAEDFSFMLQVKPGAYLRIGQGGEGSCMLHNSRYDFNDDILPLGAALHAGLIEQSLHLPAA